MRLVLFSLVVLLSTASTSEGTWDTNRDGSFLGEGSTNSFNSFFDSAELGNSVVPEPTSALLPLLPVTASLKIKRFC